MSFKTVCYAQNRGWCPWTLLFIHSQQSASCCFAERWGPGPHRTCKSGTAPKLVFGNITQTSDTLRLQMQWEAPRAQVYSCKSHRAQWTTQQGQLLRFEVSSTSFCKAQVCRHMQPGRKARINPRHGISTTTLGAGSFSFDTHNNNVQMIWFFFPHTAWGREGKPICPGSLQPMCVLLPKKFSPWNGGSFSLFSSS